MAWQKPTEEQVQRGYKGALNGWRRAYAKTSVERSNTLTRNAVAAMRFKANESLDDPWKQFEKRFKAGDIEEVVRRAVRPWPESGWKGVQVGNMMFGKKPRQSKRQSFPNLRPSNSPTDFYRALYLFGPSKLDFDDMYGSGLFGLTSPCRRFAVSFYFHKYEFAAYQFVKKDLAVRTRAERGPFKIVSGIPGSDNGVATRDADALRWFAMIERAICREWMVYGGNNFSV